MASKFSRKDKIIRLVTHINSTDANDDPIQITAKREVFASEESVREREFYAAAAYDMRPEIVYTIWLREYHDEQEIEVGPADAPVQYQLIRTYKPNPEEIELTCSGPGPRTRQR